MSDAQSRGELERIEELLADRALVGLSTAEQAELEALLARHPEIDAAEFDRAVANLDRCLEGATPPDMPPELHARLLAEGKNPLAVSSSETAPEIQPRSKWVRWSGWIVAAVCLLVAGLAWLWRSPDELPSPTLAERRLALLESAEDPRIVKWQAGPTAPAGSTAGGDVVWSDAKQIGFMTFRGLPVNDPTEEQYQLWIFDAERDERYPVDGGVFNITSESGDSIIPITAKLPVFEAAMFAISVEPPGGVVVSDRSRLPRLAKVKTD